MQELRFVAVSEDGSYAVLAVPGRSGRFILPIDERLRAVAQGQTSRLAQYEIEVESPLRPKEIQARIRAGETAEEIADAAGIPVERVRWFEGPVLAERAYIADQAQAASVRRAGDSRVRVPARRHRHRAADRGRRRPGGRAVGLAQARRRQLAGLADVPVRRPAARRRVGLRSAPPARHARRRQRRPPVAARVRAAAGAGALPGEATVTPIASRLGAAAGMGGGGFAGGGPASGCVPSARSARSSPTGPWAGTARWPTGRCLRRRTLRLRLLLVLLPRLVWVPARSGRGCPSARGWRTLRLLPRCCRGLRTTTTRISATAPRRAPGTASPLVSRIAVRTGVRLRRRRRAAAPGVAAPGVADGRRGFDASPHEEIVPVTAPPYVFDEPAVTAAPDDREQAGGHPPARGQVVFEKPEPAFLDEQLELAPDAPAPSAAAASTRLRLRRVRTQRSAPSRDLLSRRRPSARRPPRPPLRSRQRQVPGPGGPERPGRGCGCGARRDALRAGQPRRDPSPRWRSGQGRRPRPVAQRRDGSPADDQPPGGDSSGGIGREGAGAATSPAQSADASAGPAEPGEVAASASAAQRAADGDRGKTPAHGQVGKSATESVGAAASKTAVHHAAPDRARDRSRHGWHRRAGQQRRVDRDRAGQRAGGRTGARAGGGQGASGPRRSRSRGADRRPPPRSHRPRRSRSLPRRRPTSQNPPRSSRPGSVLRPRRTPRAAGPPSRPGTRSCSAAPASATSQRGYPPCSARCR